MENNPSDKTFEKLLKGVYAALETYANVHRGSGFNSELTTQLYEEARQLILYEMGFDRNSHTLIFCSRKRTQKLIVQLNANDYTLLCSEDFGLAVGVCALAIRKKAISKLMAETGGGTTMLYGPDWVLWANQPDRLEAGTPAVINSILFAKALRMCQKDGSEIFKNRPITESSVDKILIEDGLAELNGMDLLQSLQEKLIGKAIRVPTTSGLKPFINFDNSASTPTFEPVWETFCTALQQPPALQQRLVAETRKTIAAFTEAPAETYAMHFTSNTTEAINKVAAQLTAEKNKDIVVLNTIMEHSSNDLPWRSIPDCSLIRLPVANTGLWDLAEMETILKTYNTEHAYGNQRIKLVAVSGASNVLGSCNRLSEVAALAHRYGARLLVDGAQLVAHRQVRLLTDDIDYFVFSAHKVYAPFGVGVLIAKKALLPELEATPETIENAAGIAALGKALMLLQRIGFEAIVQHEHTLRQQAIQGIKHLKDLRIIGLAENEQAKQGDKIAVFMVDIKNKAAGGIARKLVLNHAIGLRYGCHCAHLMVKQLTGFTPFQEKLQKNIKALFPKLTLQGFARISFGIENTTEEVENLIAGLEAITSGKYPPAELTKQQVKQQLAEKYKERKVSVFRD